MTLGEKGAAGQGVVRGESFREREGCQNKIGEGGKGEGGLGCRTDKRVEGDRVYVLC